MVDKLIHSSVVSLRSIGIILHGGDSSRATSGSPKNGYIMASEGEKPSRTPLLRSLVAPLTVQSWGASSAVSDLSTAKMKLLHCMLCVLALVVGLHAADPDFNKFPSCAVCSGWYLTLPVP